jgi:hypothetical protein
MKEDLEVSWCTACRDRPRAEVSPTATNTNNLSSLSGHRVACVTEISYVISEHDLSVTYNS